MAKKTTEQVKRERSHTKTGRNHEILGMLKAGVSARQISWEYNLSYSGAKKLCAKLKLSGSCGRTPIVKYAKVGTLTKAETVNELKNQTNVKVWTKTIHRRLKEKGLI